MIPTVSTPLAKAIKTTEGILVAVVNLAVGIAAAIPSAHLSVKEAAIIASINTGALTVQRALIKVTALVKSSTGVTPALIDLDAMAQKVADKIGIDKLPSTSELKKLVADAVTAAQDPASILTALGMPSDAQETATPPVDPPAPVVDPVPVPEPVAAAPGA